MGISEVIPVGAWLWDKYGKIVTDRVVAALKVGSEKFKWNDAAEKYREKIKKLYGTMQIMGMVEPVPLDDIFTDLYMLDKPTAFGRIDIERLKEFSADSDVTPKRAKRINGLRLVGEKGNLFILGKPGAGKTTFLKYIALKAAEHTIDKVPIFISLKQWTDSGLELMPFITERFDICDFPAAQLFVDELLKSGNAIVLFDGLDEVNQEGGQRDRQTHDINNFVEKYGCTQCLITCRIGASEYSFLRFTYVEIADFTAEQIRTYAGNWFRNEEGNSDEETRKRFLSEFRKEDNKGLRDLARTPLLLMLLCLAFKETLAFPRRRVGIYEEAIDALLKKWDSSRGVKRDEVYHKLSLDQKKNLLGRIAAGSFESNEYFITQSELERLITEYLRNLSPHDTNKEVDGEAILRAIVAQHGILAEQARKVYSFSHLPFQEYFTARYIVSNGPEGTLRSLVKGHCAEARWREVFLLTTSLLPDARAFLATFRTGIDAIVAEDEDLVRLLAWADKRAASIQAEPWLARPYCLFLEIYYPSRSRKLTTALDLGRELADEVRLEFELDFSLVFALDRAGILALDRAIAISRLGTSSLSHRHTISSSRLIDSDIALKLIYAQAYARELGLNDLAKELAALSVPTTDRNSIEDWFKQTYEPRYEDWHEFENNLRALMIKHRGLGHEWNLATTQEQRLADYLNATRLLQECLEVATMLPDEKTAMMTTLYLPPVR